MAGTNRVLKPNQILFKAGDQSDGMYLIRRGELKVYLEQDGKEVILATVGEGGMIGEMALFDQQPRSASVKAAKETEVTLISTEDFGKLMKQIPKWFVSLMSALSSRLRQTNERLKNLESGAAVKGKPTQSVVRTLHVLNLIWAKDGVKEGKDFVLNKLAAEQTLTVTFGDDPALVKTLFEALVQTKVLATRTDATKKVVLVPSHRGILTQLATFIEAAGKWLPAGPALSDSQLALLKMLERLVAASPYDALTVPLADIEREGRRDALETASWATDAQLFAKGCEEVKLVKTSSGMGLKAAKKDLAPFVKNHEIVVALHKAGLI